MSFYLSHIGEVYIVTAAYIVVKSSAAKLLYILIWLILALDLYMLEIRVFVFFFNKFSLLVKSTLYISVLMQKKKRRLWFTHEHIGKFPFFWKTVTRFQALVAPADFFKELLVNSFTDHSLLVRRDEKPKDTSSKILVSVGSANLKRFCVVLVVCAWETMQSNFRVFAVKHFCPFHSQTNTLWLVKKGEEFNFIFF